MHILEDIFNDEFFCTMKEVASEDGIRVFVIIE